MFEIDRVDHFVIPCSDVEKICAFYVKALNMRRIEFGEGRLALGFGPHKINLQPAGWHGAIRAEIHLAGTADFCLITNTPISTVMEHLQGCGIEIEEGPTTRSGATGPINSIYFRDPDGNLVEVSNYD